MAGGGALAAHVTAPLDAPGADLFEPQPLRTFKIDVVGRDLEQLRRDDRHYVRCTVRVGEVVLRDVGVHVKGAAGSRRGFDDVPALTLNFDKFVPGQRFHGLSKLHLNNSVQDGSYLTANVCGELFRQAGVPAPRAANACLTLNGRDLGVYVIVEGFDKVFLKQYFERAKGNLYDGGFCRDITQPLEKLSGSALKEQPELKALVKAADERDLGKRWQRLQELLDVDGFISFCVLEVMCWDWDGYVLKPNNYKLYWDPDSNKITFFPHGLDQMFWEPRGPVQPEMRGLVAEALLDTPEGRQRYRARMTELLTNGVFNVAAITNRLGLYARHIRGAWVARDPHAGRNCDGQTRRICDLIAQRAAYLTKQLLPPAAKPPLFENGVARVGGWKADNEPGLAKLEQGRGPDNRNVLLISTSARAVASWRARVWLDPGRYRFEGQARTVDVAAVKDELGEGAGLRVSGAAGSRTNKLSGDSSWQKLQHEFDVAGALQEIVLVCELRASKGQVWFDLDSLRLAKLR